MVPLLFCWLDFSSALTYCLERLILMESAVAFKELALGLVLLFDVFFVPEQE